MKKFLACCFAFLFMLKLCTSCSDGGGNIDDIDLNTDTTFTPPVDSTGGVIDSLHN